MGWPTPQEYNEAIQNPRTAFSDRELQTGQPVLTPLGLPRPITGAFASVYQLVCAGQRTWAVRCFLRDFADHQERYAAISAHLTRARLPYTVNFTFLADGIRLNGRWYPILKMEWVDGESLLAYIERNLRQPARLLDLAQQWVQMAQSLAAAGIGHGDLQHGNVLVVQDRIRLIDYDGMYVPALAGRRSHEVGHRNYQHPRRSEADFSPDIDNFSTWVVYASLVALAAEPQLWTAVQAGDECLLFRREDFERPDRSRVLQALGASGDPRLHRLAGVLRDLLSLDPHQIPPIDGQLPQVVVPKARQPANWIRDHLGAGSRPQMAATATKGAAATSAAPQQPAQPASAPPAWIEDFLGAQTAPASMTFQGSVSRERAVAALSLLLTIAAWFLLDLGTLGVAGPAAVTAAILVANLGHLAAGYHRDPGVLARRHVRARLRATARSLQRTERALQRVDQERAQIRRVHDEQRQRLAAREQRLKANEQELIARAEQKLKQALDALQERRQRYQHEEAAQVKQTEARFRQRINEIDQQLSTMRQTEATARQKLLAQRRQAFVAEFLARQTVQAALINGIGPGVKQRLNEYRVVRAADVTPDRLARVPGIGATRAEILLDWRRRVEQLAWQAAPVQLGRRDEVRLRRNHEHLRRKLEKERQKLDRQLGKKLSSIRERYARRKQQAADDETRLQEHHRRTINETRQRHRSRIQALRAERTELDRQAAYFLDLVEQDHDQVQQEVARLDWDRAALAAQLDRFANVDFPNYVRRVVLPLEL